MGLEALPINAGEVVGFGYARRGVGQPDSRTLVASWITLLFVGCVAIWGRSVVLGALTVVGVVLVALWTVAKWRVYSQARRLARSVDGDDA